MAAAKGPAPVEPLSVHVDWLRNTLSITGPGAALDDFREAAAGAGVIPWAYDLDRLEEDWFLPMAAPVDGVRAISVAGAHILARRLREAVALNQARAIARMASDRSCPFDLQRLIPVPATILALGPDEPAAQAWLRTHWGTGRALRHVRLLAAPVASSRRNGRRIEIEFWAADWSPWAALRTLTPRWPALRFALVPDYGGAGDGG